MNASREWSGTRAAIPLLAAAFLFNLGQGVLRPSLPLYLQQAFAANYKMVTLIPVVFGAGKWVASVPAGYYQDRIGRRRVMVAGLLLITCSDLACMITDVFGVFLGLRALAGLGWAMFGTVATTTLVDRARASWRGRAISLLMMAESVGLLIGSAMGGWLYQRTGATSPFGFEAACMLLAAAVVASPRFAPEERSVDRRSHTDDWRDLGTVLRMPPVGLMGATDAGLIAIQTGVLVFLYPLYLFERGKLASDAVGYLVSVTVLGRLLGLWLGGAAADRWSRERVLVLGLVVYAVVLASLGLTTMNAALLALWSLAIGAAGGVVGSLPTTIVGDRVAAPYKGIAIGWLRTARDTGMLLGPPIMGALGDAVDILAPFVAAAVLLILLAATSMLRSWSAGRT